VITKPVLNQKHLVWDIDYLLQLKNFLLNPNIKHLFKKNVSNVFLNIFFVFIYVGNNVTKLFLSVKNTSYLKNVVGNTGSNRLL